MVSVQHYLQTTLNKLVSKVDGSFSPTRNQINATRSDVLLCSLRALKREHFNPEAEMDVVFVDEDDNGEGAVDPQLFLMFDLFFISWSSLILCCNCLGIVLLFCFV